jgi:two-component system chemotaxis sensor kinase CheA
VPALIVRSGTLNCAIPQVKIVELVRLSSDDASQKLVPEMLEGGPVLRLRGRLLPLLSLSAILAGERGAQVDLAESTQIVIVKSDGHDFALAVEDVSDSIDIVVKPFVGFLKSLRIFSGATVLGDGTLALILDIAGLRERCVVDAPRSETATGANDGTGDPSHAQRVARGLAPEFLLCGIGEKEVVAIPLPQVFRLEEFHPGDVEIASNTPVARYRGGLLPLILLSTALGVSSEYQELESIEALLKADRLDVVVIQRNGRHFGLVVSRIEDIIRASGQINDLIKPSAGALGTILEGEDVYTVVNVTGIVDVWLRDVMGETPKDDPAERTDAAARILFVEDSPFFRKYTASVLQSARYDVRAAAGGREALDALSAAARGAFDVVLTDIDMPGMTGLELAREIRSSDGWYKEIPIVALTSLITPRDQAAARAAGIDEHLEKVQLDQIPALLAHVLGRVWKSPQEEGAA